MSLSLLSAIPALSGLLKRGSADVLGEIGKPGSLIEKAKRVGKKVLGRELKGTPFESLVGLIPDIADKMPLFVTLGDIVNKEYIEDIVLKDPTPTAKTITVPKSVVEKIIKDNPEQVAVQKEIIAVKKVIKAEKAKAVPSKSVVITGEETMKERMAKLREIKRRKAEKRKASGIKKAPKKKKVVKKKIVKKKVVKKKAVKKTKKKLVVKKKVKKVKK